MKNEEAIIEDTIIEAEQKEIDYKSKYMYLLADYIPISFAQLNLGDIIGNGKDLKLPIPNKSLNIIKCADDEIGRNSAIP